MVENIRQVTVALFRKLWEIVKEEEILTIVEGDKLKFKSRIEIVIEVTGLKVRGIHKDRIIKISRSTKNQILSSTINKTKKIKNN